MTAALCVACSAACSHSARADAGASDLHAESDLHETVVGAEVERVEVLESGVRRGTAPASWQPGLWADLSKEVRRPGLTQLRFSASGSMSTLELPTCAGRRRVWVDGASVATQPGDVVLPLQERESGALHEVRFEINISAYEHRIACAHAPRVGCLIRTREGLGTLRFDSPHLSSGGGFALLFVPPGHDFRRPGALLVGLHPWNGSPFTYAAYDELLREAAARDVALLLPSGLGNSLYTAAAEDEVERAIAAAQRFLAIDPRRVSLWGASMGGAGATTIGFHRPDRFASVTSFFGDSKYDRATYVRSILTSDSAAHLVNALDVVDNARNLPVWLVHGDRDVVSPLAQSRMLAHALAGRGFSVRLDVAEGFGHDGALVARHAAELVDNAAVARVPDVVARVTYRSVAAQPSSVYGVRFVRREAEGDAFVDIERRGGEVVVHSASGIDSILLPRGAFGLNPAVDVAIRRDEGVTANVRWDALPASPP